MEDAIEWRKKKNFPINRGYVDHTWDDMCARCKAKKKVQDEYWEELKNKKATP